MKKQFIIHCNLCTLNLPQDELIKNRLKNHTLWHSKAWIHHRNTTQGIPTYSTHADEINEVDNIKNVRINFI